MLNENNKLAIYFDIINFKICLVNNIRYHDEYIENNDSEKLFINYKRIFIRMSRVKQVNTIKELTNGGIDYD